MPAVYAIRTSKASELNNIYLGAAAGLEEQLGRVWAAATRVGTVEAAGDRRCIDECEEPPPREELPFGLSYMSPCREVGESGLWYKLSFISRIFFPNRRSWGATVR